MESSVNAAILELKGAWHAISLSESGMSTWQLFLALALLAIVGHLTLHFATHGFGGDGTMPMYPFLGITPSLQQHRDDLYDFVTDVLKKSPTMSFLGFAPGHKWFFTANPAHIQHILKDNFANYPKGTLFQEAGEDFLGRNIFIVDGEEWKQQRKVASHEFSTNSLRNMIKASIRAEIEQRLIPTLDSVASTGKAIDMQEILLRFTFDNICRIGFGVEVGALSPDFPVVPFVTSVDKATALNINRFILPPFVWKFMRRFNLGFEAEFVKEMKVVDEFVNSVVAKRRMHLEQQAAKDDNRAQAPADKCDLLSRMIALGEKDHGQMFSDSLLRDSCLGFLIAGRDTTAVSISWLLWHVSQHPAVEQKILEELQSVVARRDSGENDASADKDGSADKDASGNKDDHQAFSFEEIKDMVYVHAAINESLRLKATVGLDSKLAKEDDVLPDGTAIPKGTRVTYAIYSQGYMTQLWGPDACEFKPERWITEEGQVKVESPFKFAVFNAGPRLCLGRELAYMQMKAVMAALFWRYKLQMIPGHEPGYVLAPTIMMRNGLPMVVALRGNH